MKNSERSNLKQRLYAKNKRGYNKLLSDKRIWAAGAVILFIIIYALFTGTSTASGDIPTYKVMRDNFLVSLTESGEIRAINAVSISTPRIRGNLKIIHLVPQGSYVQPGDTVARFDPTEALQKLKEAESALEVALSEQDKLLATQKSQMTKMESDLKSAELQYELSKLNLEQMKFEAEIKQQEAKLQHKKNELSYNKAKQDFTSQKIIHKSELNKMNVEIQQKRADLERAQRDLEMLTLTAPKEGLVVYETNWATGRKIAIGDTPWPGMTIITLPDLSAMQSLTFVNEVDVSRVKDGQKVLVTLDAFQDSTFEGTITSVASLGKNKDRNSTIKVFEIEVAIHSQSDILKPGMTTSNKIIINEIPDVVFVPHEAVFESEGTKVVYIKSNGSYDKVEVVLGEKSEDYVVVKSGVKETDIVALRDPTIDLEEEDAGSGDESVELPA